MQGTRLDQLRKAADFDSMAAFARAAGIKEVTATKHIQRDRVPTRAAAKYIDAARGTGADIGWLLTGKGSAPKQMSRVEPSNNVASPEKVTASVMDEGISRSVRIWTVVASHGPGGSVLITEGDETLPAPGGKRISKSAFRLQIWDNANSPSLRRGSHIYVDPMEIPGDGQWCLLAAEVERSSRPTLYKPVVGVLKCVEDSCWVIQQGPAAPLLRLPQSDWPLSWLIVLLDPI